MTEQPKETIQQQEEQATTPEPEEYYCGLHGFVSISHFPCSGNSDMSRVREQGKMPVNEFLGIEEIDRKKA